MTAMRFAYLIEHLDPATPADRRGISGGTRNLPADWSTRALAEDLIQQTRIRHSYLGGSRLRCSLWLHHADEPAPLTPGAMTAPSDADVYEYGDEADS